MIFWGDGPNYFLAPRQIYNSTIITKCNGLSYSQSQVRAAHVVDGASNTYYAGEKHVNPRYYAAGRCYNDDQPAYGADDMDLQAWTVEPPLRDDPTSGMTGNTTVFGSAHAAGIGMVFCDGAVRRIRYDVNPTLHSRLGNREDRQLVNLDAL